MFQFPPSPQMFEIGYSCWQRAFKKDELTRIVTLGESLPKGSGRIFADTEGKDLTTLEERRRCQVSWIEFNEESRWLYEALVKFVGELNSQYYRFDLFGFVDSLQYTVYEQTENGPGHYDWHIDMGPTKAPRKLSITVNLNEPEEYEGGDLEFRDLSKKQAERTAGHMHAFPSWTAHRVTPVTRGIRRSLVGWAAGPAFR